MQLKKGMVIHCKTEDEAREFIREAYKQGFEWDNASDKNKTHFGVYREDTVYSLGILSNSHNDILYGTIKGMNKNEVIEYSDLIKFKKSNLKSAMVVELRDGDKYLVHDDLLLAKDGYIHLNNFNEDLTLKDNNQSRFDIIRIYESSPYSLMGILNDRYLTLIWERKECKRINFSDNALEILKRIPIEFKWLTKDDDNDTPWVNEEKPTKDSGGEWICDGDFYALSLFRKYFENVTSDDLIYIDDYVDRQ